jgi:hypothetical protein
MKRETVIADDLMGMYPFWMTDAGLGVTIDSKMYNAKKCKLLYDNCRILYDGITKREYEVVIQIIINAIKQRCKKDLNPQI